MTINMFAKRPQKYTTSSILPQQARTIHTKPTFSQHASHPLD